HDDGYIITGVKGLGPYTNKGVWLLKTDEQGDSAWARTFGSVGDVGACVQVTSDRGYIICGSTCSYAPLHRGSDVLLMKTDSLGEVGVEEQPVRESPIQLSASLNRLSYNVPGEAKLTLYSSDGRRVLTETIQGKGTWTPSFPPSSHLPAGVYFARVEGDASSKTQKVVLIK
ncbi:MAG: T9SS type A sorting domain-containing protein, partial [candidate division WOR-3 bacterium]|nr:T9SS type A sorting domain-containing protein [candidate division WOR-3 bacterium]